MCVLGSDNLAKLGKACLYKSPEKLRKKWQPSISEARRNRKVTFSTLFFTGYGRYVNSRMTPWSGIIRALPQRADDSLAAEKQVSEKIAHAFLHI